MFSWFGRVSFVPYSKVQDFAVHLKNGYLMGSRCTACGYQTFPPRADCPECMSDEFEFVEYSGRGTVWTHTRIDAPPTGFDDDVPYTCVVVELEEGGRLLAWSGETLPQDEVAIDMDVQVVPRIFEDTPDIRVYYTVERPGTTWHKAPTPEGPTGA
jgi:uncharacterized OB-fold protein